MKHILRRCFSFLKPYWPLILGAYTALVAMNGLSLLIPQLIRSIIDRGIKENNIALIGWSVLGLLGISLIRGVFTYFQGMWSETASQGVAFDIRNTLHAKLASLSFSYHDRTATGEILSRSIQDVDRIRFLTGRAFLHLMNGALLLVGTFIIMISMNARLAILSIMTMPLMIYYSFTIGKRFRPLFQKIQEQLAVLTTSVEQSLQGAHVVKAFAQEGKEIERFNKKNEDWFGLMTQSVRIESWNIPLLNLIANIGTVFVIWYGGRLVVEGQITIGELVAFTTYLSQLISPIRRLGHFIVGIARAQASGERILEILDLRPEVKDLPDAKDAPGLEGQVTFENVSFSYLGRQNVLSDISFEVRSGQTVALLGTTGSGKSSIINLIPRFYDPTEGRILVDGQDLRSFTLQSLRSQIAVVLQDTTLFATSIRENIGFGKPDAKEEEIAAVAEAAQAHEFISVMSEGYDTLVGERGHTLSGGQKQRIAIARALLNDPKILILDDATASVDTETEHLIQLALENLMIGRTSFVIAQRLSTVRKADLILVLDGGKIAARGSHQELIGTSGIYADIYNRQLASPVQETEEVRE